MDSMLYNVMMTELNNGPYSSNLERTARMSITYICKTLTAAYMCYVGGVILREHT